MSCSHTFHFICLTTWFGNQVMKDLPETCPCCRHKANEHEGLPEDFEEEESEEEASSVSSESTEPDLQTVMNMVVAADHFAAKRAALSEDALKNYAATRIQAVMRAYPVRMDWIRYKMLIDEHKNLTARIEDLDKARAEVQVERRLVLTSVKMSRARWHRLSAIKIQAAWRGSAARRSILRNSPQKWVRTNTAWTRQILRCTETWSDLRGLAPQSLAFYQHETSKKIQAAWRGYRIRKAWKRHDGKGTVLFSYAILNAVLLHLGGTEISYKEFRELPALNKESFRDLCTLNAARDPTEIEWREAAGACGWIPKSLEEDSGTVLSTFVPRIKYLGIVRGWTLSKQYCRKATVIPAAVKIQAAWRGYRQVLK